MVGSSLVASGIRREQLETDRRLQRVSDGHPAVHAPHRAAGCRPAGCGRQVKAVWQT